MSTETAPQTAAPVEAARNQRHALAARSSLHVSRIEHLLGRYGALIDELLELIAARPELAEPIPGAEDHLKVEAVYAASHEGALHLDDVLTRRTRVSIETFDRGVGAAPHVAALMAEVHRRCYVLIEWGAVSPEEFAWASWGEGGGGSGETDCSDLPADKNEAWERVNSETWNETVTNALIGEEYSS